jgi:hypothetical protein
MKVKQISQGRRSDWQIANLNVEKTLKWSGHVCLFPFLWEWIVSFCKWLIVIYRKYNEAGSGPQKFCAGVRSSTNLVEAYTKNISNHARAKDYF